MIKIVPSLKRHAVLGALAAACLLSGTILLADEIATTQLDVECPEGGRSFILWIEGTGGLCEETGSGVFECREEGRDYVRASCEGGCEETVIEISAGCFEKSKGHSQPSSYDSNHTFSCPGRQFDLKGVAGGTCTTETDRGAVVGGQCSQPDAGGSTTFSAKANCKQGCLESRPPGDCTERP